MIRPEEQRIMNIMEVLGQTNLFAEEELKLAEDYLLGDVGRQELDKLPFRDLSGTPAETVQKLNAVFSQLMGRGGLEEAKKLARFLFAAGESTCAELLMPNYVYNEKNYSLLFPSEPEVRAAAYAPKVGKTAHMLTRSMLCGLGRLADNDPENLKKALAYQRSKAINGKLVLLGVYLCEKYPAAGQADETADVTLEEQDVPLLAEYEELLVRNLPRIYTNQAMPAGWKEIEDAVNNDRVDARILKMAEAGSGVNQYMVKLLGGISYINYNLSARLKNVVKICLRADTGVVLDIMYSLDMRGDMGKRGGSYDEIFAIEPLKYIGWATGGKTAILKAQFARNRECFLEYMATAEFGVYNVMASVLKEEDPKLYKARMEKEVFVQRSKITDLFIKAADGNACQDVKAYLEGKAEIGTLYPYGNKLLKDGWWREIRNFWDGLKSYKTGHGHDSFSDRCEALMMLCRGFEKYLYVFGYNDVQEEKVKRLFSSVDSVGLALKYQLDGYSDIAVSYCLGPDGKKVFEDTAEQIFQKYLTERREEMLAAIRDTDSVGRVLGLKLLSENLQENKGEILKFAQDTAKGVKEGLLTVLYGQKDWEEDIIALLSSKKAADRDVAVRVLAKWDGEKYGPLFAQSLEKEKNGKVRALLDNALNGEGGGQSGDRNISREDLVKEIHKGNKKRTLAWAYETPFSKVHRKSGEEATEEYLQAILLAYSAMSPCGISPSAAMLAEDLKEGELAVYMNELFDKWLSAGAESKKRWVLYAAAIHGGSGIVGKMHHQIQEWPQAARGAIASEAVQALTLNPAPQALLIVDGISRKFKFKQVKAAAGKALEFAASQLGITREELADRIVPDLGFDENMERRFDYGERRFTVTITPALEIEVFDENGKKLKNLPAPGKRDDEGKAAASYEEFKQMKKQMKATVGSQKMRLEMALSTERRWGVAAWKDLFVKNPIMHQFAIGLIWGVYEGGKLVECFRYMEDGSFNTEDEEEFELPGEGTAGLAGAGASGQPSAGAGQTGNGMSGQPMGTAAGQTGAGASGNRTIGLVHPIELSKESLETWKQQLEDYEIVQPVEQLDRPVYYRTKEEEGQRGLERFGGCIVNDLSLGGKLMGAGWYRGSVQDAGGFYTYYREDPELSLGVELHFSGSYVGGMNEDVTVYEARFYDAGTIKRGSYEYDEADDKNSYLLKDVPERYFSEIVLQLSKAVSSGKDKNENWKAERR